MTIRKKHNTQDGILIDTVIDILNKSGLENSSAYINVTEFNEHFDATHLTVSILFTLISLPFHIILIN